MQHDFAETTHPLQARLLCRTSVKMGLPRHHPGQQRGGAWNGLKCGCEPALRQHSAEQPREVQLEKKLLWPRLQV